jgi:hypothetical protein
MKHLSQAEEKHLRDIIRRTRTECFGIKFAAWLQDGFYIQGGKNKPVRLMQSKTGDSRNGVLVAEYPTCYDKAYIYACISELIEQNAQKTA